MLGFLRRRRQVTPPLQVTPPARTPEPARRNRGRSLFDYGDLRSAPKDDFVPLDDVTFCVLDFETTGLSSADDRIVEIAAVVADSRGQIVDEYATLLDPGCDVGPTFIHHITNEAVAGAPRFEDVAGEILSRCDGNVVVAHNAPFEEAFLAAELARAGIHAETIRALCTLEVARHLNLPIPNHRLKTCCDHFGVDVTSAHTALGDARATAALTSEALRLLQATGAAGLSFSGPPSAITAPTVRAQPRHRVSGLRRGEAGWMAGIVARLPVVPGDIAPEIADKYLELVADALADGRLTGDEAKALGRMAGHAGLGSKQVADLNLRFLEGMKAAALEDGHVTADEARQLAAASKNLGAPTFFDDLNLETLTQKPRQPDRAPKQPAGRLVGQRILFCGGGAALHALAEAAVAEGALAASYVTASVALAVSGEGADQDPRLARAATAGVQIVGPDAAWSLLGLTPQRSDAEQTPVEPGTAGTATALS